MSYLYKPVAYLVADDFDTNGKLTNPEIPKDKPVLVMVQSNWCHFCTLSKPEFQQLAYEKPDVFCATIQADGDQKGEKELGAKISKMIPNFKGFPTFVGYKNGELVDVYEGPREKDSLYQFISSL